MDLPIIFENDLKMLMPEIFLVLTISILLVFGAIYVTRTSTDNRQTGTQDLSIPMLYLSSLSLFFAGLLSLNGAFYSGPLLHGTLFHDSLTATAKGTLFIVAALCLLASKTYLRKEEIFSFEYPIFILLATFGMGLLLSSYDLISMYLALELQSLSLYVLATFKRDSAFSTEAGLKYFIMGAFSSGLILFGCSLIYGYTGTTNFEDLGRITLGMDYNSMSFAFIGGLIFLSTGLLFKLAAAPFHMWSPDVYEGSPTSSTLFFAAVPKLAILIVLVRLYYQCFYDFFIIPQSFLIFASAASMLVAALGALYQRRIKRFLAFSSIGHVGYLLMALSCGTLEGLQGLFLYVFIYMVMSLNIWTVVLSTSNSNGDSEVVSGGPIKYIDELSGLQKENPLMAFTVAMSMFSMAGIPPLAGFCAKLYVFFAAMESSLYGLAILGVLTSTIGAFYYLRWIKIVFFENKKSLSDPYGLAPQGMKADFFHQIYLKSKNTCSVANIDREKALILAVTTIFLVVFFAYPTPLLLLTHKMALAVAF